MSRQFDQDEMFDVWAKGLVKLIAEAIPPEEGIKNLNSKTLIDREGDCGIDKHKNLYSFFKGAGLGSPLIKINVYGITSWYRIGNDMG